MPNGGTTIYPGVRHPNFPASTEDDDEDDEYGYYGGCPECGAGGSGDPYGECVCYPE